MAIAAQRLHGEGVKIMKNMTKYISGWICTIIGIALGVYSLVTISNDKQPDGWFSGHYTYQAPLTGHETLMILLVVVAVIFLIVGIMMLVNSSKSDE